MGDLIFWLVVIAIIAIMIIYIVAKEFSSIAKEKGYEENKYFWYTFFLGIVGILMVIALPDRKSDIRIIHDNIKKEKNINSVNNLNENVVQNTTTSGNSIISDVKIDASLSNRVGELKKVDQNTIICSSCGFEQPSERTVCWKCGCKFNKEDKDKQ